MSIAPWNRKDLGLPTEQGLLSKLETLSLQISTPTPTF